MIDVDRRGAVTVLRLDHGKVNALDVDLLHGLVAALDTVEDSDTSALVLTSATRAFSAGVDLPAVVDGGSDYVEQLIPALSTSFLRLFSSPLPVVAAVNGAAVAGGCILACCADRVVLGDGARIGATELFVGVPFPVGALEVLRFACGVRTDDVVLSGTLYQGADAVAVGLADELAAPDVVLDRALEIAEHLGSIPAGAFRLAKQQLRRPVLERLAADGPVLDPAVRALWAAPETIASLVAQMERLAEGRRSS